MTGLKNISYAKVLLVIINFLSVLYNAGLYLFTTKYIIAKGMSHTLLENLTVIPTNPNLLFWLSILSFVALLVVLYIRDLTPDRAELSRDWLAMLEVFFLLSTFLALKMSYNGLILLVFMDIFFSYTDFYNFKEKRYWLIFIVGSFGALLLSNYDLLSLIVQVPSLTTYIDFYPTTWKIIILFIRNFLNSLNMIVFIVSLVTYIIYSVTENHKIEEELRMAAQANNEMKNYVAVTERIAEDRERKRIAREIHDTLGHALTGISAGIDAVMVLIDLNPEHAKKQLQSVSNVVREGIVDVRRSLNKLRPGALENNTLKDALDKMIAEYADLSQLQIDMDYQWEGVDFDKTKEDVLFRVIQESVTNSLRHGHATKMMIELTSDDYFRIIIQDNGKGCADLHYGYGLTQMRERLGIIGGRVTYSGDNGFRTEVTLPKQKGEEA